MSEYPLDFPVLSNKDLKELKTARKSVDTWGGLGLLGFMLKDRMKFNNNLQFDFPNAQLNWSPTKNLDLYIRPDSIKHGKTSGINIGGSYKF
tara:strand:+ start:5743 stop:6018 length:276 start_codon:yes stop_codon:yes gene_type:complete